MKKLSAITLSVCMGLALCACGESHTHSYSNAWSQDQNNHWHACTGCDEKADEAAHSFDAGVITTPATKEADGVKLFTCTVCGQTKTAPVKFGEEKMVTEAQWKAAMNKLLENNVTLEGYLVQESNLEFQRPVEMKVQGDTSYMKTGFISGRYWEEYYVKTGSVYTRYGKNSAGTAWETTENMSFGFGGEVFLQFMPFVDSYDEFTYNEDTGYYETSEKTCESAFGTLAYESIKVGFENGKLVYCFGKMSEPFVLVQGDTGNVEYSFHFKDYGATVITLPSFE